jgi:hypothetical protein
MECTFDVPLSLDSRQAAKVVIRSANLDLVARELLINITLYDDGGNVLEHRQIIASGAAVQTYLSNQEATIYTRLLAKLGVTGNVV